MGLKQILKGGERGRKVEKQTAMATKSTQRLVRYSESFETLRDTKRKNLKTYSDT